MVLFIQFVFGFMTLLGVGIIVFTKNIIHAAYALALTLIGVAGVYVILNADFLAVVQILLYAGGVVILLAFGVMMTNRLRGQKVLTESKNRWIGGLIAITSFIGLAYLFSGFNSQMLNGSIQTDQVKQIGVALLTDHLVAFELIAFILLVALVGAAYLAKMSTSDD